MEFFKAFLPSRIMKNPGRAIISLSHILYAISLLAGIICGFAIPIIISDWEGAEAFLLLPFTVVGGALAGLILGLLTALPLKGFGVIVEHCQKDAVPNAKPAAPASAAHPVPIFTNRTEAPSSASVNVWCCTCGVSNPAHTGVCSKCGTPKPVANKPVVNVAPPAPPVPKKNVWVCSCGTQVSNLYSTCSHCGSSKPEKKPKQTADALTPITKKRSSFFAAEPTIESWTCSCGQKNPVSKGSCEACGSFKPMRR